MEKENPGNKEKEKLISQYPSETWVKLDPQTYDGLKALTFLRKYLNHGEASEKDIATEILCEELRIPETIFYNKYRKKETVIKIGWNERLSYLVDLRAEDEQFNGKDNQQYMNKVFNRKVARELQKLAALLTGDEALPGIEKDEKGTPHINSITLDGVEYDLYWGKDLVDEGLEPSPARASQQMTAGKYPIAYIKNKPVALIVKKELNKV